MNRLLSATLLTVLAAGCGVIKSAGYHAEEMAGLSANPMPDIETVALVFINASSADFVDETLIRQFTQVFHTEIQQFPGFRGVPPLAAYNVMRVHGYQLPTDARAIAATLEADALLVGLITDYYPYENPRIGLDLILFPVRDTPSPAFDVRELQQSGLPLRAWDDLDMNLRVHRIVDSNHADTPRRLAAYAYRRASSGAPDSTDQYLMVMPQYMAFVSNQAIRALIGEANARIEIALQTQAAETRPENTPPDLPF